MRRGQPGTPPHRNSIRLLTAAWGFVLLGVAVLVARYARIQDPVVLDRPPWADTATIGPKSLLTVGRIAMMGVGQLGAATAMVFASRDAAPWERFWSWLGLVAGVKTLLECAALTMPQGSGAEHALNLSTIGVVAVFLLTAAWWWRRGDLRTPPRLEGSFRTWLVASLALWALFALAPRFVA